MRNVLIVEDSDVDRMVIETLLSSRGFVCVAAEDGVQALEKLKEWSIDVVVTDLNMPRMDGLELVKAMRTEHRQIPIILTTGVGSEKTAAEALSCGASSYIPKQMLAELLVPSVQRVLDIQDDAVEPKRLDTDLKGARFEFEFGNDPQRLRTLVEFVERILRVLSPLDRNDRLRISMAIDQALHNAMYRGNLEIGSDYRVPFIDSVGDQATAELVEQRLKSQPYAERTIQVILEFKRDKFGIRIRDRGPGFDSMSTSGWEHPEARGIILMKALMDKVEYNPKGNDVQLYYYFKRAAFEANQTAAPANVGDKPALRFAQLTCLHTGTVVRLGNDKLVVGSRENCHIRLNGESKVAPLHCMFVPEGQSWSVVQISPQFETLVNMQPVVGRARLNDGDTIAIGNYGFELNMVTNAPAAK